jgi:hypothetical protein
MNKRDSHTCQNGAEIRATPISGKSVTQFVPTKTRKNPGLKDYTSLRLRPLENSIPYGRIVTRNLYPKRKLET